jgi:hypothetical protein
MDTLPFQQVTPCRCLEPILQIYNLMAHEVNTAARSQ